MMAWKDLGRGTGECGLCLRNWKLFFFLYEVIMQQFSRSWAALVYRNHYRGSDEVSLKGRKVTSTWVLPRIALKMF
uniref:Uncharacterized protein n=1 Tax=Arundo donax TaxID=35708 RepID=A0A0A9DJ40_ARUDO